MIFAKTASLFLLLALCMSCPPSRAQNQTPVNNGPVVDWTDSMTGLTWAKEVSEWFLTWNEAKAYCVNLRLGGHSDWRLPTIDELQGIYDPRVDVAGHSYGGEATIFHVKGNLKLTGVIWSSTQKNDGQAWTFSFFDASRGSHRLSENNTERALCVRR
jgi:hypothetical protein